MFNKFLNINQLCMSLKRLPRWRQHFLRKWFIIFCQKSSKFCLIHTKRFCSNFTCIWPKYLSNNVWRDFRLLMLGSIMVTNLPLKIFCATVAIADNGSEKSHHTLFCTYLDHMLAKFKPNRMVQNVQNVEFFDKKLDFLKPFLTKRCRHFARRFCR